MCYLAGRLHYVETPKKDELINYCNEVTKIIAGLMRSIEKQLNTKFTYHLLLTTYDYRHSCPFLEIRP